MSDRHKEGTVWQITNSDLELVHPSLSLDLRNSLLNPNRGCTILLKGDTPWPILALCQQLWPHLFLQQLEQIYLFLSTQGVKCWVLRNLGTISFSLYIPIHTTEQRLCACVCVSAAGFVSRAAVFCHFTSAFCSRAADFGHFSARKCRFSHFCSKRPISV